MTTTSNFWAAFDQVVSLWPLILGIVLAGGLIGLIGWSALGLIRPSEDVKDHGSSRAESRQTDEVPQRDFHQGDV